MVVVAITEELEEQMNKFLVSVVNRNRESQVADLNLTSTYSFVWKWNTHFICFR